MRKPKPIHIKFVKKEINYGPIARYVVNQIMKSEETI